MAAKKRKQCHDEGQQDIMAFGTVGKQHNLERSHKKRAVEWTRSHSPATCEEQFSRLRVDHDGTSPRKPSRKLVNDVLPAQPSTPENIMLSTSSAVISGALRTTSGNKRKYEVSQGDSEGIPQPKQRRLQASDLRKTLNTPEPTTKTPVKAAAKQDSTDASILSEKQDPSTNTQARGASLLDRILAKQAHAASLPAGPTKQELERRAALQRIEEIARVLELLAAGRARCSFSMQAITQQLQQSLRNPISRAEIELCLELMAGEITTGFIGIVRNGGVTGVVLTRSGKVGLNDLRERVRVACQ